MLSLPKRKRERAAGVPAAVFRKNVKDLRDSLRNELRNMRRDWGKSADPNLQRWLGQQGWTESEIEEVTRYLQQIGSDAGERAGQGYISEDLAAEVLELLETMGVLVP